MKRVLSLLIVCIVGAFGANSGISDEVANFIEKNNLKVVDYDYAKKALKNKKAIFVDARIKKRYDTKTIRTSINIPLRNFDKYIGKLKNIDKNREIIVFCDGLACNKSTQVALKLINYGFNNVKVYQNGMPEWEKRDYSKINISLIKRVLKDEYAFTIIDLRDKKSFSSSHIKHSININNGELAGKIPINKLTPLAIISDKNDKNMHTIAEKLVSMGYQNVGVYEDGYKAWQKLKTKELKKAKNTKNIPEPFIGKIKKGKDIGTVDSRWFLDNYKRLPPKTTIVDVREKSERRVGFIRGSKHISLGENSPKDFIEKLPKDRYIIFYCERGNRAYDAYEIVQDAEPSLSNKVVYLDAIVNCERLKCSITPNKPTDPTIW